eukprot:m.884624 g.884624  ORF g.884624 m.884624 type:complete len:144 (-) comp23613_c0_seq46:2727-3158(-)
MTSCVVLYRVSFCTVPHPFHNQALALGEDIDRKKQAAIAEVKAEKLNLDSQRLELHVHTLREPPRDSVAYNEWKIATEGLEQSAGQLVDESKVRALINVPSLSEGPRFPNASPSSHSLHDPVSVVTGRRDVLLWNVLLWNVLQ